MSRPPLLKPSLYAVLLETCVVPINPMLESPYAGSSRGLSTGATSAALRALDGWTQVRVEEVLPWLSWVVV